jgi:hypothetical protein
MEFIRGILFVQPSLWSELIWRTEVSLAVCGGPHAYRNSRLFNQTSVLSLFSSCRARELTPSGMKCPLTVSPPAGTVRTKPIGADGKILRPSSMTAVKYGSLTSSSNVRSFSDLKLSRISFVSLSTIWRLFGRKIWLNKPVKKPAVVSVPAILITVSL